MAPRLPSTALRSPTTGAAPLFPRAWSDRLEAFFSDVTLELLDGVGHFIPVEAPEAFAAAIRRALA